MKMKDIIKEHDDLNEGIWDWIKSKIAGKPTNLSDEEYENVFNAMVQDYQLDDETARRVLGGDPINMDHQWPDSRTMDKQSKLKWVTSPKWKPRDDSDKK